MGARSQSHLKAFTLKTGWVKTHADVGYVFFGYNMSMFVWYFV